jgi:hypothetical protein
VGQSSPVCRALNAAISCRWRDRRMIEIDVDLRNLLGPARDQGARPTCLAFAASDTHAATRGALTPLSCEYAFFHAQQRGGRSPHEGASWNDMLSAIEENGQPAEEQWAYLPAIPIDLSQWVPPNDIGELFGRRNMPVAATVGMIRNSLNCGSPVLIVAMLSNSFFSPSASGVVEAQADERSDPNLMHALIAVGHGKVNGQLALLIRNSWGAAWGIDGHAWLTDMYLKPSLVAAACLTEECDVSCHTTAT